MRLIIVAAAVLAAGCTPVAPVTAPTALLLHPYATVTPSATFDRVSEFLVTAETPLPTSTPSQYTIQPGDTLSQIAERFRISLDALMAANPSVSPSALRVGDPLVIPGSPLDRAAGATPTPVPVPIREIACHPTANGAVWCFVLISNDTPDIIENVTAQVTLLDSNDAVLGSKTALLPLDILEPGTSLPLSVLFPPPIPLDARPQVQMLTAMPLIAGDQRYRRAATRNVLAEVLWSGRSAEVRGEVLLTDPTASAGLIWVAAVAYDESGNVVGWRRWENAAGLAPGASMPFELLISSLAGRIDRVEFAAQARP